MKRSMRALASAVILATGLACVANAQAPAAPPRRAAGARGAVRVAARRGAAGPASARATASGHSTSVGVGSRADE